jgi:hypothetical protein
METKTEFIQGVYLKHCENGGFTYQYVCSSCGRKFRERTPEVSAPCLCHWCFTGNDVTTAGYHGRKRRGRPS